METTIGFGVWGLELYRDDGKEIGNYNIMIGVI